MCLINRFEYTGYAVAESVGVAVVTVVRGSGVGTVTVGYHTVEGTALAGKDFVAVEGTLVFEPGEMRCDIEVK